MRMAGLFAIALSLSSVIAIPVTAGSPTLADGETAFRNGNYGASLAIFRDLAAKGDADAEVNLGMHYLLGKGVARDEREADRLFALAASAGNPRGEANLGIGYRDGRGVPRDFRKGQQLLSDGAKRGNAAAQFNLGLMYARGMGMPVDVPKAYVWFSLAAEQGVPEAVVDSGIARKQMTSAIFRLAVVQLDHCRKFISDCN